MRLNKHLPFFPLEDFNFRRRFHVLHIEIFDCSRHGVVEKSSLITPMLRLASTWRTRPAVRNSHIPAEFDAGT